MSDGERFEFEPEQRAQAQVDSEYERRRLYVLNMLQGKSGSSAVVDFSYDHQVLNSYLYYSTAMGASSKAITTKVSTRKVLQ